MQSTHFAPDLPQELPPCALQTPCESQHPLQICAQLLELPEPQAAKQNPSATSPGSNRAAPIPKFLVARCTVTLLVPFTKYQQSLEEESG